jgi:hypothetical protein
MDDWTQVHDHGGVNVWEDMPASAVPTIPEESRHGANENIDVGFDRLAKDSHDIDIDHEPAWNEVEFDRPAFDMSPKEIDRPERKEDRGHETQLDSDSSKLEHISAKTDMILAVPKHIDQQANGPHDEHESASGDLDAGSSVTSREVDYAESGTDDVVNDNDQSDNAADFGDFEDGSGFSSPKAPNRDVLESSLIDKKGIELLLTEAFGKITVMERSHIPKNEGLLDIEIPGAPMTVRKLYNEITRPTRQFVRTSQPDPVVRWKLSAVHNEVDRITSRWRKTHKLGPAQPKFSWSSTRRRHRWSPSPSPSPPPTNVTPIPTSIGGTSSQGLPASPLRHHSEIERLRGEQPGVAKEGVASSKRTAQKSQQDDEEWSDWASPMAESEPSFAGLSPVVAQMPGPTATSHHTTTMQPSREDVCVLPVPVPASDQSVTNSEVASRAPTPSTIDASAEMELKPRGVSSLSSSNILPTDELRSLDSFQITPAMASKHRIPKTDGDNAWDFSVFESQISSSDNSIANLMPPKSASIVLPAALQTSLQTLSGPTSPSLSTPSAPSEHHLRRSTSPKSRRPVVTLGPQEPTTQENTDDAIVDHIVNSLPDLSFMLL